MNKYKDNFGSVYENIKYENPSTRLMYLFYILKRLIFVYLIFFVKIECVPIVAFIFLLKTASVLHIKPYINKEIYRAELFNEIVNLIFFVAIQAFKGPYIDPIN